MRYTCTIYSHDYTFGGTKGLTGSRIDLGRPEDDLGPVLDQPLARVVVSGRSVREAAARAYVKCVGRERAKQKRENLSAPREVIAQETNCKAIAASLRKTVRRIGECYEMDDFVAGWFIKVEPAPAHLQPSSPRLLRFLSLPFRHRISSTPSPN